MHSPPLSHQNVSTSLLYDIPHILILLTNQTYTAVLASMGIFWCNVWLEDQTVMHYPCNDCHPIAQAIYMHRV